MKYTKNMLFIVASAVALFNASSLSAASVPGNVSGPVLEIYNKSNNNIRVTIFAGPSRICTDTVIYANNQWKPSQAVNANSTLDIHITDGRSYQFRIDAPGKTKYVTWNPAKSMPLYPQTGPLMGFMGKTESGLSLSNNISASNIQKQ